MVFRVSQVFRLARLEVGGPQQRVEPVPGDLRWPELRASHEWGVDGRWGAGCRVLACRAWPEPWRRCRPAVGKRWWISFCFELSNRTDASLWKSVALYRSPRSLITVSDLKAQSRLVVWSPVVPQSGDFSSGVVNKLATEGELRQKFACLFRKFLWVHCKSKALYISFLFFITFANFICVKYCIEYSIINIITD